MVRTFRSSTHRHTVTLHDSADGRAMNPELSADLVDREARLVSVDDPVFFLSRQSPLDLKLPLW